jgi:hypothetical protein
MDAEAEREGQERARGIAVALVTGPRLPDPRQVAGDLTRFAVSPTTRSPSLISHDVQDVVQALAHPIGRG